ncbi:MAG: transketolase [bacterium]|nr:transketolase [bacterium]
MASWSPTDVDLVAVNTIRFLAVDMVERANSGHPGAPMGLAALGYTLFARHLRHSPTNPEWPNRDRFVLSCGHASALIYGLLHLSGYDLSLDEIKNFRQFGSKTPGHPEYGLTPGVETTTGPLGQGISTAVGMAIAHERLAAEFNQPDLTLFDYRTWVLASDGDLMEGVASEACSLAGHLKLGSLKVFWDDNRISIDGSTDLSFSENVAQRFAAYGWNILRVEDGNDLAALDAAAKLAAEETERPTLVVVRTHIGFGSPNKQDSSSAHGSPLGKDEVELTKKALGWPLDPRFHIPEETREAFSTTVSRGKRLEAEWKALRQTHRERHGEQAAELDRRLASHLPEGWESSLPVFTPADGPVATRKASGAVLNALAPVFPEFVTGSADLTGSVNTYLSDDGDFSASDRLARNFRYGVREHAMGAILNGLALSKAFIPYAGTFLVFSDYMRASVRLAALMEIGSIFVFTHDSIFLGEDGPTHQPEGHLASLRAVPQLTVLRPADANEVAAAWAVALERRDRPSAIVLTRQKLPILEQTAELARDGVARGGYILSEAPGGSPGGLLIATGSEVAIALEAQALLAAEGVEARVVSLPSWELFEAQNAEYRESVLPAWVTARVSVEAGASLGWHRYVGSQGATVAVDRFGASAPYADLLEPFGFTPTQVAGRLKALLSD